MAKNALAVCLVGLLALSAGPARADWDDTHYYLTYVTARLIGYTPEQAYRVAAANASVNVSTATWPRQMDAADFVAGADPDSPPRLRARWAFHAFIDTAAWLQASKNQETLPDLWTPRAAALRALAASPTETNPGVWLHFLQDQPAHQKLLGTLDGYLRATAGPGWFNYRGGGPALVQLTAKSLAEFLADIAPTQRINGVRPGNVQIIADAFTGANAAPAELTATDEGVYLKWALSQLDLNAPTRPFTKEQLATMQSYWRGPDLDRAAQFAESVLKYYDIPGPIPPVATARKQFQFDMNGKVLPAQMDQYLITGALRLTLQSADGQPQEPVEVVIKGLPTQAKQAEYDLSRPLQMSVPGTTKWEQMPIGKVHVELRRAGTLLLRRENVVLDKRGQEIVLKVGAPAAGSVWVLKDGFPKINPTNAPVKVGTPAAAGIPWTETILTRLTPELIGLRVVQHTAEGKEVGYGIQYTFSQAPPKTLPYGQSVALNVIGQLTPRAPGGSWYLDVRGLGLRVTTDDDKHGSNMMQFGRLGDWDPNNPALGKNETFYIGPDYPMTDLVKMDYQVGAWAIHWEWQKQEGAGTTVQQPTTPTTPTGPGVKLGLNVKVVQGANGPEVVIGSITPGSPLEGLVEVGDVILNFDGTLVTSVDQIKQIMSKKQPDDTLEMQIRHEGEIEDLVVRL